MTLPLNVLQPPPVGNVIAPRTAEPDTVPLTVPVEEMQVNEEQVKDPDTVPPVCVTTSMNAALSPEALVTLPRHVPETSMAGSGCVGDLPSPHASVITASARTQEMAAARRVRR